MERSSSGAHWEFGRARSFASASDACSHAAELDVGPSGSSMASTACSESYEEAFAAQAMAGVAELRQELPELRRELASLRREMEQLRRSQAEGSEELRLLILEEEDQRTELQKWVTEARLAEMEAWEAALAEESEERAEAVEALAQQLEDLGAEARAAPAGADESGEPGMLRECMSRVDCLDKELGMQREAHCELQLHVRSVGECIQDAVVELQNMFAPRRLEGQPPAAVAHRRRSAGRVPEAAAPAGGGGEAAAEECPHRGVRRGTDAAEALDELERCAARLSPRYLAPSSGGMAEQETGDLRKAVDLWAVRRQKQGQTKLTTRLDEALEGLRADLAQLAGLTPRGTGELARLEREAAHLSEQVRLERRDVGRALEGLWAAVREQQDEHQLLAARLETSLLRPAGSTAEAPAGAGERGGAGPRIDARTLLHRMTAWGLAQAGGGARPAF